MGFSVLHLISLLLLWYFLLVPVMLINFSGFLSFVFSLLQSYIVYLGSHSHGPNPSASDLESATNSHYKLLGSHLGKEWNASGPMHVDLLEGALQRQTSVELQTNLWSPWLSKDGSLVLSVQNHLVSSN